MAAEAEAKRRGADDAVFVDGDGTVLEGPTTNVWWRRGRTLYTPSLDLGILAGVTRAAILDAARDAGLRGPRGRVPARRAGCRRRGLHVVVGARGDAGRRARRHADRTRAGRRRAPGRAAARGYAAAMSVQPKVGVSKSAGRDGPVERRRRARPDGVGGGRPHPRRRHQGRVGAQARARAGYPAAVPARPAAPARGVRVPAGAEAPPARGASCRSSALPSSRRPRRARRRCRSSGAPRT